MRASVFAKLYLHIVITKVIIPALTEDMIQIRGLIYTEVHVT